MFFSPIPQTPPETLAQWVGQATGAQMKYLRAWAALAVQAPLEQLRLTQAMIDSGQVVLAGLVPQVAAAPEGAAPTPEALKAKPRNPSRRAVQSR